MAWRYVFTYFLAFFSLPLFLQAQNVPCMYSLELKDATGQGWSDAALELQIRNTTRSYTLEQDKQQERFFFQVYSQDTLVLNFLPGLINDGVAFVLYNQEDSILYQSTTLPNSPGELFRQVAVCPSCPAPPPSGVFLEDIRAYSATIGWIPSDLNGQYLLEFDTLGFTRGKGKVIPVFANKIKLTGLNQHTNYAFYLSVRCSSGDTSRVIGPLTFKTLWANDVGVSAIFAPLSGCALSTDSIKVGISNYGGQPQSLIPFLYAVNGKKASISMPKDGLFTGVIGKDSTEEATFDQVYDFSATGEYILQAWTELKADSLNHNDSVTVVVVNAPTISSYPYFNNLDQGFTGWYVDAQQSKAPSWKLGYPNGNSLNGAFSGQRAWTTNLTGTYAANEWSYLLSPCLDFTNLRTDPTLSLALRIDAETCCDGAWMEMSIDAGETWSVLGQSNSGTNWYNHPQRQVWTGNGGAPGWFIAAHPLTGVAGLPDVRLRLVFRADYARNYEGIAVDNIRIAASERDVAALQVRNNTNAACGSATDQVVLSVGNLGNTPVSSLQIAYQVNGGAIVQQSMNNQTINPEQKIDVPFTTRFNSLSPGTYHIKAWIVNTDPFAVNDTIFYTFSSAQGLPFAEHFERGTTPKDWNIDTDLIVTKNRSNTSFVLSDNLNANDRTMQASTPAFGPIVKGDSLTFDYRFTDATGSQGVDLGTSGRLDIQISTDCGNTYRTVSTINNQNHLVSSNMQRFSVKLDTFNSQYIRVRFLATWGQGDYYVDLDNIQVLRCPASLDLSIQVSTPGTPNRTATVISNTPNGPFTYQWNTGGTAASIPLPSDGIFEVTVTDRFGCRDMASTLVTHTHEILHLESLNLVPNPTSGITQLQAQFPEPTNATVQVISIFGQVLQETRFNQATRITLDMHLNAQPDGIYLVRIQANGKSRTEKLVLIRN